MAGRGSVYGRRVIRSLRFVDRHTVIRPPLTVTYRQRSTERVCRADPTAAAEPAARCVVRQAARAPVPVAGASRPPGAGRPAAARGRTGNRTSVHDRTPA